MKRATKGTRPRIGLDLHTLEGMHQGSRTHCLELFSRVIRLVPEMDFVCLADTTRLLPEHVSEFTAPNARLVHMPQRNSVVRLTIQLPKLAGRQALDLLHTQYIRPLHLPAHTAVTIHDVLFEEFPQYFERMLRLRSKILFRFSARRSDLVFTVSKYSKGQISQRYGVPPPRITTLYNGADSTRLHPGIEGADQVRELGLSPGEYLLSVGRLEPRKNYRGLLQAFSMLPAPRPKLVIVGQPDFGYQEIFKRRDQLGLGEDVVLMSSVEDSLLAALYRHARLFLYPTFAEGFGMPVIEAMASGIPVITSNTTSLPEIAADAALLIDPHSPESIRKAILRVLMDEREENRMREAGLVQARTFRWEAAAAILAQSYRDYFS